MLRARDFAPEELGNFALTVQALDLQGARQQDLFGTDDSAYVEGARIAQAVTAKQKQIEREISTLSQALALTGEDRREFLSQVGGELNLREDQARARLQTLRELRSEWQNWSTDPEKVLQLRDVLEPTETVTFETVLDQDPQQALFQSANRTRQKLTAALTPQFKQALESQQPGAHVLTDILVLPDLLRKYPHLSGTHVTLVGPEQQALPSHVKGRYFPPAEGQLAGRIFLRVDRESDAIIETLTHELQHGVQYHRDGRIQVSYDSKLFNETYSEAAAFAEQIDQQDKAAVDALLNDYWSPEHLTLASLYGSVVEHQDYSPKVRAALKTLEPLTQYREHPSVY